jgi:hypothetical protein
VRIQEIQLLGATAVIIACKHELEIANGPLVDTLAKLCADQYTKEHFLMAEHEMLKALDCDLNLPIASRFLAIFVRVSNNNVNDC